MSSEKIRAGVVGVGRMGRHHARVYAQTPDVELVGVADHDAARGEGIVEEWGGTAFQTVDELIAAGVDAVTIATPTTNHLEASRKLLAAGVACLVEKPLAPSADEAQEIADAAERSGAILQVGHIVRYDPVMLAIRELGVITPRFVEMDRVSPMTFRSVDVGVVLDMMIHDLDLLLMLTGCEPDEIHANAVCVLGDAEDVCNARLVFPADESGLRCVANITASRLAMKTERKLRLIGDDTYVSADFGAKTGTVVRRNANDAQLEDLRGRLRDGEDLSGMNYLELLEIEELNVSDTEPLRAQIDDFLDAVRTGRHPTVDAQAGSAAVRTAERIVEAARAAGARLV